MRKHIFNQPIKSLLVGIVGTATCLTAISVSAGIVGSRHDLRSFLGLGANAELCVVCHTPHDADTVNTTAAPLWNHAVTAATFVMYDNTVSSTLDGAVDPAPTGTSKLCLSCHDGTVGLDDFGGGPNVFGPLDPANPFYVGTDLTGQHPISIVYDNTLDAGLNDPTTPITVGGFTPPTGPANPTRTGTIGTLLVPDGKVQCSSCHDVHNTFVATQAAMLRIDIVNSNLCLTCHNK